MKALLAACIAGATTLIGVIWLVGGHTPAATLPVAMLDAKPVALPDVSASIEPSVPGSFLIRGFPFPGFHDDRASSAEPSRPDAAPDAGAEKAGAPALAAAAPETP